MTVLNVGRFARAMSRNSPQVIVAVAARNAPQITQTLRASRRFESDLQPILLWRRLVFPHFFALISLTSIERRERMLTGHPQKKHANPLERTKGMMNSNRERKRILLVEDEED